MEYHVNVTMRAQREADEAHDWIAQYSPRSAARWYRELFQKIESLQSLPERCSLAAEGEESGVELRQLLHGKRQNVYRILFVVRDDVVDVLSVWHAARGPVKL